MNLSQHRMASTSGVGQQEQIGLEGIPRLWFKQLVQQHLKAKERLQLFRVCKVLAATVVEHSPHIKLELVVGDHETHSTDQLPAKLRPMQMLIAPAHSDSTLHVHLMGRGDGQWGSGPVAWEALPMDQITQLSLCNLHFTIESLCGLQLQRCTQLRTLHILGGARRFSLPPSSIDRETLADIGTACFPSSLVRLCAVYGFDGIEKLGAVLGTQITSFVCIDPPPTTYSHVTHYHRPRGTCKDADLDIILALPSLTHVTLPWPELAKDRRREAFKIEQLLFKHGASMDSLVCLPVQCIQFVTIRDQLHTTYHSANQLNACARYLDTCPNFQCMPKSNAALCMPAFWLMDTVTPALVSLCAHNMTEPGCLCFHGGGLSELLPSLPLSSDATNVTCLAFIVDHQTIAYDQVALFWQQAVALLPSHLTRLALEGGLDIDSCIHHASCLASCLVGCQLHQSTRVEVMTGSQCTAVPQQLQELMHKYPGRVKAVLSSMVMSDAATFYDDDIEF